MSLSIADIDRWDSDAINAVSQASTNRAQSTTQASGALGGLSAFDSWQGPASTAALARTQLHATGLETHGQDASGIANATRVAANEVNQIKTELSSLRASAASWGIRIDPVTSRAIPPPNLDSLSDETRQLVQTMTKSTQATIDSLRTAADNADGLLANAVKNSKHEVKIPVKSGDWDDPDYRKKYKKDFGENKDKDAKDKKPKKPEVTVAEAKTRKVGAVVDKDLLKGEHKFGENGPTVKGNVSMDALTAQAGANAKASTNGISAGANANATLVGAEAKGSADWGIAHGDLGGRAAVEANAEAKASIGKGGVNAGAEAFVGGRLTGDANVDVGGVGVGAHGELQAGIGVSADIDAGIKDGKLKIGGSVGACLGVGGKGSFNVEIDPGKVTNTIKDGVKNVGKWFGF